VPLLHTAKFAGTDTVGVGLTVTVTVNVGPVHGDFVGVIV